MLATSTDSVRVPLYGVRIRRFSWCDYGAEVWRGRFLVGEAFATSPAAALGCAVAEVRRRRRDGALAMFKVAS